LSTTIQPDRLTKELLDVLGEAFESVQGFFLDPGTSLFETLAEINAAEASIPVGGRCATLAAQVAHINFYLETLDHYLKTGVSEQADWGEIWRTVGAVTPDEWAASQDRLRQTYQRLRAHILAYPGWETEGSFAGAIALVAHTAYHLGEIRQATCILKSD
jgi:hypothetical protein